tara:strand:- start:84881 stop:87565 length:2685 start_codon:yes stop_codon:yes gene_type:complete
MRNALSILLFASALVLVGCSGGGTNSASSLRIRCLGGESFCIISCDLGCSQTGCSVTEIAENQQLRFKFSDAVDPSTVTGSSISIRTATGVAPEGSFEVVGSEVVFRPRVSTVNGISTFGFARNESYIISLAGGSSIAQSVTNLSGDGLSNEFSCTVVASRGILDEDGEPPTVELLSPTVLVNAPVNPTIVLRFSELIDTTPLQVSLGEASPIRVVLRGTLPNGQCDNDSDGTALEGVPQLSTELVGQREVTVVTFQPSVSLPGNSCITVRVTADLRDLSGRSGVPAKFVFLTEQGVSTPILIKETFASNTKQQVLISGGIWGGAQGPGARPGLVGGDGRHGTFDPALGTNMGNGLFVFNVDNTLIPASSSLTGLQYQVTDGRFFFTDMIVPTGMTIRFVGTVPPVIHVRGQVKLDGTIEVNGLDAPGDIATTGLAVGQSVTNFPAVSSLTGQPGTLGGVGGGQGGAGGNRCLNAGPILVAGIDVTSGQPGSDLRVPAGHAYMGSVAGTGGGGGLLAPATGMWPTTGVPTVGGTVYCAYFSPGGGGGGFSAAGGAPGTPTYTGTSSGSVVASTAGAAGSLFNLMPYPPASPPPGYTSLEHFTIGGSGGGGGGSHGYGIIVLTNPAIKFMAGHGGTGGGGAVAIRSGGTVVIGPDAVLSARGGDGVWIIGSPTAGNSSPGGAGSGGSFLVQSGQAVSIAGTIDARGGNGSENGFVQNALQRVEASAGDGAPGFFRMEAPNSNVSFGGTSTPTYVPSSMGGNLTDRDDKSGDTSLWYATGLVFPPTWSHYELDVDLDGDGTVDVTYDDTGAPGTIKASEPNGPITLPLVIRFQGANLNQAGTEPVGPVGMWRDGIGAGGGQGISLDSVTGFRFSVIYNRALFPDLVVKELRVIAQT